MHFYVRRRPIFIGRSVFLYKLHGGILRDDNWLDGSMHFDLFRWHLFNSWIIFMHKLLAGILFE